MRTSSLVITVGLLCLIALAGTPVTSGAAARTVVACVDTSTNITRLRERPRACTFPRRGKNQAFSVNRVSVSGLRWRGWGDGTATATGTYRGNNAVRYSVRVTVSRLSRCFAESTYTRLRITAGGKTVFSFGLPASCG